MSHKGQAFTLALYRVKPGAEDAFIAQWRQLAETFKNLPSPPIWGTLIRSTTDLSLFYSFGPWHDAAHVAAMRANPAAQKSFSQIAALCSEMTPGNYEVIEQVVV